MKNLLALSMLILFSISVNAQFSLDNKTLVTIGDEKVTVGEFMKVYNKNNNQASAYETSTIEDYLDLFINFKLKVKEAEELKMDTSKVFQKELNSYREQLAKPYFVDENVNEALLEEAYERMQKDIRASHILIMVDENASAEDTLVAYNKIIEVKNKVAGGMDFSEAAVAFSEDPSVKDREAVPNQQGFRPGNKGDLGYFTVFNMVYPFETAAYSTELGDVSEPVRTKFGYHLLKINDIQDAMGTVQVAHIFVALRPDASTEDSARKAEKINNISEKIKDGMTFEDAVVQYSEDKGSARNGGQLSKFTCNRVVPEFVETVSNMEINDISEPVKTMYGFHIIKLLSCETPGTFEEEAPKLKERIAKDQRAQKSEEAVIQKIKAENGIKVYEKAKDELYQQMDTTVFQGKFKAETLTAFTKPILKIGDTKYSQYEFAKYIENNQAPQEVIDLEVYLNRMLAGFENEMCLKYEDQHLEENYPEFKDLMQEYHDGILLFNLTDEKVWSKAVIDTSGLETYFNAHNEDYMWEKRVDATVYEIRDKDILQQVQKIIDMNNNDGDIALALEQDSIQKKVKIKPGYYEKGDNAYVDQVEWKQGLSDQINSDVENLVVFVKIREVLKPTQKSLNEARGLATADYQGYLEKAWVQELKEKYPVNINQEVLQKLLEQNK
ncbi:MAG: peptidylprolyl isomerase [Bacteroidetes bacterium]|nr:peptidylprolyl isomerase [Bacteroidota bacterium]